MYLITPAAERKNAYCRLSKGAWSVDTSLRVFPTSLEEGRNSGCVSDLVHRLAALETDVLEFKTGGHGSNEVGCQYQEDENISKTASVCLGRQENSNNLSRGKIFQSSCLDEEEVGSGVPSGRIQRRPNPAAACPSEERMVHVSQVVDT
jgi:hypothetical protein